MQAFEHSAPPPDFNVFIEFQSFVSFLTLADRLTATESPLISVVLY
jgi:hypothetical protein